MAPPFHRTYPFPAKIKERKTLTQSGSTKSTYHLTLDITGSNLTYKVGDSVGIYASNDPTLVLRIITALKADPLAPVTHPRTGELFSLKNFLETEANLARVTTSLMQQFQAGSIPQEILSSLDLLDVALQFGNSPFDLSKVISSLPPLLPRFYSIASSQELHPNEIHLLVSLTTFHHRDELRYGVASHLLCHRADLQTTTLPCYIQPTPHFTLPSSHDIPIIMVGPGTGVAPFRAFLQERLHRNAPGKNWLFFGERNQKTDFFYEDFWTSLVSQQKLCLDLAFSRDQPEKIYVQHKLLEKGADIWAWLQQGAFFYICGEADPMAKEVEAAFLQICTIYGSLSLEESKAFLKNLRRERRYLADVY